MSSRLDSFNEIDWLLLPDEGEPEIEEVKCIVCNDYCVIARGKPVVPMVCGIVCMHHWYEFSELGSRCVH